jgi:hypothetical protein
MIERLVNDERSSVESCILDIAPLVLLPSMLPGVLRLKVVLALPLLDRPFPNVRAADEGAAAVNESDAAADDGVIITLGVNWANGDDAAEGKGDADNGGVGGVVDEGRGREGGGGGEIADEEEGFWGCCCTCSASAEAEEREEKPGGGNAVASSFLKVVERREKPGGGGGWGKDAKDEDEKRLRGATREGIGESRLNEFELLPLLLLLTATAAVAALVAAADVDRCSAVFSISGSGRWFAGAFVFAFVLLDESAANKWETTEPADESRSTVFTCVTVIRRLGFLSVVVLLVPLPLLFDGKAGHTVVLAAASAFFATEEE